MKYRRITAMLLIATLTLSLCITAAAAADVQYSLDSSANSQILNEYAAEISIVEEAFDVAISQIDSTTSPMIQKLANRIWIILSFVFRI